MPECFVCGSKAGYIPYKLCVRKFSIEMRYFICSESCLREFVSTMVSKEGEEVV